MSNRQGGAGGGARRAAEFTSDTRPGSDKGAANEKQPPTPPTSDALFPTTAASEPTNKAAAGPTSNGLGSAPPANPRALLEKSIERLGQYGSISAKLRQRIDMFDQQIVGSGAYLQGPPGSFHMRMEVRVPIGEQVASTQWIANGEKLWLYRQLSGNESVQSVDLLRVRAALDRAGGSTGYLPTHDALILGGLPRLLQALDQCFDFAAIEPQQLGSLPVWTLRGEWKKNVIAQYLERAGVKAADPQTYDLRKLPQPLPDYILILFGREDLFPYRFEYRRREGPLKNKPFQHGTSMLVMEWFDIRVNESLDPQNFRYAPPADLYIPDKTERTLRRLGLTKFDEPPPDTATTATGGILR